MSEFVAGRFRADAPKRMLALDGGGTRGVVSIAFLERMERVLAERFTAAGLYDDPAQFRLAHYFDLIGGTSAGSLIATQLALGEPVHAIRRRFDEMAHVVFRGGGFGFIRHMFHAGPLTTAIKAVTGNDTFASERLVTGLAVVMKRMDTGSVWPVSNNPAARYWNESRARRTNRIRRGIRDLRLWEVVRASTAAPRYFSPHRVRVFEGFHDGEKPAWFIDGAVSPHNSPALQLFMMAGMKAYNLGGGDLAAGPGSAWALGEKRLLLVSVGTGTYPASVSRGASAALDAVNSVQTTITDGTDLGLMLLQWLSRPNKPWHLDRVVRDLDGDVMGLPGRPPEPMLAFQRYDLALDPDWLEGLLASGVKPGPTLAQALAEAGLVGPGARISTAGLTPLRELINLAAMPTLAKLAEAAAGDLVSGDDFPPAFDHVWKPPEA